MAVFDSKLIPGCLIFLSSYAQKAGQLSAVKFRIRASQMLPTIRLFIDWSQKPVDPDRDCLQGFRIEFDIFDLEEDPDAHVNATLLFHPLTTEEMKSTCYQHLNLQLALSSRTVKTPHSIFNLFHLTL